LQYQPVNPAGKEKAIETYRFRSFISGSHGSHALYQGTTLVGP
jgi:hypothetical protein